MVQIGWPQLDLPSCPSAQSDTVAVSERLCPVEYGIKALRLHGRFGASLSLFADCSR